MTVKIGGFSYKIVAEHSYLGWPRISTKTPPPVGTVARLTPDQESRLLKMRGFGRPDWASGANPRPAYIDHINTRSYGEKNKVIKEAACYNWALTGATVFEPDKRVYPQDLLDMNTHVSEGHKKEFFAHLATRGLTRFLKENRSALYAWLGMPQGNAEQIKSKVEAMVRIMCLSKGMTFPADGSTTPYSVCCEYSSRAGDPPNFDHWGLQIRNQSIQTIPGLGLWKNKSNSFVDEWSVPGRTVIQVPVENLSPVHLIRLREILAYPSFQ